MTKRRFTDEEERQIAADYDAGSSSTELAAKYHCDLTTVLAAVRRSGFRPRSISAARTGRGIRQFSPEQQRDVAVRWKNGESQTAIGRVYGAHQVTIGRLLRRMGVEPEARGAKGATHGRWKGGRAKAGEGYILVASDEFPSMRNAMGYILEHRLVMARHIGRPLTDIETVHHRNGDRSDNRIENLELHVGRHGAGATSAHCTTCNCFAGLS